MSSRLPQSDQPSIDASFWGPRYWLTRCAIGCMWLMAKLPFKLQIGLGRLLGRVLYCSAKSRKHIAATNLRVCFPELDEPALKQLVKDTITENAIGLVETASAWWTPPEQFRDRLQVEGLEHLQAAKAQGRGVLLVGAHYTTLDMGGLLVSLYCDVNVMYRPNANPLFDRVMKAARQRFCHRVMERHQMREVIASLKCGEVLWYAPDQDYGRKQSVFAPFFGVSAASIKATARLAKINHSPVIILRHHRNPANDGYTLSFSPEVENYPSGDDVADATVINQLLEQEIRKCPQQYMWVHRRFKTRPEGEAKLY